jgi:hypothetical protein
MLLDVPAIENAVTAAKIDGYLSSRKGYDHREGCHSCRAHRCLLGQLPVMVESREWVGMLRWVGMLG